jgi:hypothetical protein
MQNSCLEFKINLKTLNSIISRKKIIIIIIREIRLHLFEWRRNATKEKVVIILILFNENINLT